MSSTIPENKPEISPQPLNLNASTLARLQYLEKQRNELRDLLFEVINDDSKRDYRRALIPAVMKLQREIIAIKRGELVVNSDGTEVDDANSTGGTDDLVAEALYKASNLAGERSSGTRKDGPSAEKSVEKLIIEPAVKEEELWIKVKDPSVKKEELWIKVKEPSAAAAGGWVFVD